MLPEEISEIIDLIIIDEESEENFLKFAGECKSLSDVFIFSLSIIYMWFQNLTLLS
jgi:hypothetical protein